MIRAILLAAGQSKRLKGENKLIRKFKNKELISYAVNSLIKSKISKIIIVSIPFFISFFFIMHNVLKDTKKPQL